MATVSVEGSINQGRESYLRELFEKARTDEEAFTELCSIAAGRNDLPLARQLLKKLEESTAQEVKN